MGLKISMRAARVNKGLNLVEAAHALGCTVGTLRNYELGASAPNAEMIDKMLRLYGMRFEHVNFLVSNPV